jgi:hypothetical protein
MEYRYILLPISLGLLLPSLAISWATIDFLGHHSYLPINILGEIINHNGNNNNNNQNDDNFRLLDITSTYHDSFYAIVFSMIIYLVSILVVIATILFRKHREKIALAGGILAIIAVMTWIYAIDSFKSHFAQEAASTGGLIAGEWKGKESLLINRIVMIGPGHNFVIIGGVLAISTYAIEKLYDRKNTRNRHQQAML